MPTEHEVSYAMPEQTLFSRIVVWCAALLVVGFVALGVSAIESAETRRHTFLAKCIEFQTLDRCRMLYAYGRQDLMEKR